MRRECSSCFKRFRFQGSWGAIARRRFRDRSMRAANWVTACRMRSARHFDNPDLIVSVMVGDGES